MVVSNTHILGIAASVLLASAGLVEANAIVLSETPYSYSVAGEFSMAASDNFVANYAPSATLGGQFETFCVESEIYVQPGYVYSYVLSDHDSMGRGLTAGAAWLYYQFATGQLAGYDYATPAVRVINAGQYQPFSIRPMVGPSSTAVRQLDAGELQAAIWAFQGGQTFDGFPDVSTDPFYQLAISVLGVNGANSPDNSQYGVDIIQLWGGTTAAQNQLVYLGAGGAAVPDSFSTIGFFFLACAGLIFASRRQNLQERS